MFLNESLYIAPERELLEFAIGNFSKQVLICNLLEPDFPQSKDFLSKVLAAVQINLEKDTLFAEIPDTEPVALSKALRSKQPEQVLVFGVSPRQLGLGVDFIFYRPFQFSGATLLFCEKLSLIEPDRERKGKLWGALKLMFSI